MTNLRLQKRIAAQLLKVGQSKVWIDPTKIDEVKDAITKADIRKLIQKGYIKKKPAKVKMKKEKKARRGPGKRKGSKHAKISKKRYWINTVRPLRRFAKQLKEEGKIDNQTYKKLYKWIKGNMFRSRRHMLLFLKQRRLIKED